MFFIRLKVPFNASKQSRAVKVINLTRSTQRHTLLTIKEEDAVVFVDYLSYSNDEEQQELIQAVRRLCSAGNNDPSVSEKLRWLAHYADYKLGSEIAGPRFT